MELGEADPVAGSSGVLGGSRQPSHLGDTVEATGAPASTADLVDANLLDVVVVAGLPQVEHGDRTTFSSTSSSWKAM